MTTPPPEDRWTVAVHTGVDDFQPIGAGVIAGERAVLTCAHVVAPGVSGEHRGDGRAFTLHEAAQCLPGERPTAASPSSSRRPNCRAP